MEYALPPYESPLGTIRIDPAGFVHVIWSGARRSETEFRIFLEHFLRVLVRLGTGKALVDQRAMQTLSPTEQTWVTEDWLPRAVSQGQYRYAAVLPAVEVVARLAATNIILRRGGEWPVYQQFESESDAVAWLVGHPLPHETLPTRNR